MAAWKSPPFPYDLILEIPYDVKVENNSYAGRLHCVTVPCGSVTLARLPDVS